MDKVSGTSYVESLINDLFPQQSVAVRYETKDGRKGLADKACFHITDEIRAISIYSNGLYLDAVILEDSDPSSPLWGASYGDSLE